MTVIFMLCIVVVVIKLFMTILDLFSDYWLLLFTRRFLCGIGACLKHTDGGKSLARVVLLPD